MTRPRPIVEIPEQRIFCPRSHGVRARADDAHAAGQDVEELRNLVEARPAEEPADPRDPVVGSRCRLIAIGVAILQTHRTKLEDMEFSVAQADAFLPEQGRAGAVEFYDQGDHRSEEHTSELQSPMRTSYAVLYLKKQKNANE